MTPLPTSSDASQNQGLPSGAKAGVGIGVALGLLVLLAGAVFLYRRQSIRTRHGEDAGYGQNFFPHDKSACLDQTRGELDSSYMLHELESISRRQELHVNETSSHHVTLVPQV